MFIRRYKEILGFCLVACVLAGCKCPAKKTAVEEKKEPAVTLVTPQEPSPTVTPKKDEKKDEGQATPQQVAKAIKNEPIPEQKIPEDKVFKSPEEISPSISDIFKNIHFDFDKYDIRPDAQETLKVIARYLLDHPKTSVIIEGHCDERGTREYNLVLGEQRALSTRRFLISLGVSPDRLHTVSYGEDKPLDPASNEEAWAKNRRAEFKISE